MLFQANLYEEAERAAEKRFTARAYPVQLEVVDAALQAELEYLKGEKSSEDVESTIQRAMDRFKTWTEAARDSI